MSKKNTPVRPRKAKAPSNPARKSRTKTRKPKYLSLKLQLSRHHHQNKTQQKPNNNLMPHKQQQKQLINLFPLHPENLVQDHKDYNEVEQHHDDQVSDQVAFLFETTTDDTSTSLHAILDSTTTTTTTTTSEEGSPLSPSLTYAYRGHKYDHQEHEGSSLVKTAMKCKERDASEERWVSYWEVVEKKEQEEVSSNCCYAASDALEKMVLQQQSHGHGDDHNSKMIGLVGLKLDYQEILNAWSDKGPLYIDGESPQTVPDLLRASNGFVDGCGNLWTVPELGSNNIEKEWKLGQREASVLRYKEKRQSRLFSKRIRYEVRKLNAEKRPRLKGRFVKRNGEE